jgi:hypothetical protein
MKDDKALCNPAWEWMDYLRSRIRIARAMIRRAAPLRKSWSGALAGRRLLNW